jgi:ABC-type uncharacterized transport system YnjBCD permease subunit
MLKPHNKFLFSCVLEAVLTCFALAFAKYCPETCAGSGEEARNTDVAAPLSAGSENGSAT